MVKSHYVIGPSEQATFPRVSISHCFAAVLLARDVKILYAISDDAKRNGPR